MIKLNCKINSDLKSLEKLYQDTKWTPNPDYVRPKLEIIQKKDKDMENITIFYQSLKDYILDEVFNFKSVFNSNGKMFVPQDNIIRQNIFSKNKYPYQLPTNTNHYLMWYTYQPKTDYEINQDIFNSLKNMLKNTNFNFVWYINPKQTIPELFHVQVFWISLI